MEIIDIEKAVDAWAPLAGTIFVPHTEEEYNRIVGLLDELIDEVGENESHPLASMMEILGVLIEHYENAHVPELTSE
jgi:HTH-type transcriptional regulator / antitoxin HigA